MAKCISPVTVRIPDSRGFMAVPCGKCMECLSNKRADWTFRLTQELKRCLSAYFITLTYSDENLPVDGNLRKMDLTLFIKRLRRFHHYSTDYIGDSEIDRLNKEKWPSIKYYAVGEYGEHTLRPHYHIIIFNINPQVINRMDHLWKYGFIKVGTVTSASIHYVTKYVINRINQKYTVEPFSNMSKKIGIQYLRDNWQWHKSGDKNYVVSESGVPQRMPRYYSDKVFNFKEKEKIVANNFKRMSLKETEDIARFNSASEFFSDSIVNREQKVSKFSRLNKKDQL